MKNKAILFCMIMVVSILGLSGCQSGEAVNPGASENAQAQSQSQDTVSEGPKTLTIGMFWLGKNIDPIVDYNGWTVARFGIGQNLVQLDENMVFQPTLAQSYEKVDALTTVFEIRENITFHNGKAVDAQACKASIERTLSDSTRTDATIDLHSITAEGQTLTIKTNTPDVTLVNKLADTPFIIVDVDGADDENYKYNPIGTGPFMVDHFDPETGMELHRYEDYWGTQTNIDVVDVKLVKDANTRAMALQTKEIDMASQLTHADMQLFEGHEDYTIHGGPNLRVIMLTLNFDKPYIQEMNFRKALLHGIDKETYARELVNGLPAIGPFAKPLSFAYQGEEQYAYDPALSNKLLDEIGYMDTDGDGFREYDGENIVLEFVYGANHGSDAYNTAVAMQQQYKQIGIDVLITQTENYTDKAKNREFDLLWERMTSAPTADSNYFLKGSFAKGGASNYGAYHSEAFEDILAQFDGINDQAARDALGLEAVEHLIHDAASMFMYFQEGNIVTTKDVEGIHYFVSELYYLDERVNMQ